MTTYYSHAEIRPTVHQPLNTGPVFDGLPEGADLADLDFQGATDLPDNTEWAIFTRDSGERLMIWRVESKEPKRNYVYAVYRHGSNAANQSLCNKMIVGTIQAGSREEACELMRDKVTVYNNQWLSAVPFSRLGKKDQWRAYERDLERIAWERNLDLSDHADAEHARKILADLYSAEERV